MRVKPPRKSRYACEQDLERHPLFTKIPQVAATTHSRSPHSQFRLLKSTAKNLMLAQRSRQLEIAIATI
jgi:hypothetical protein